MSFDIVALAIGYSMLFAGGAVAVFFFLGLAAGVINEKMKDIYRAASNTYWWIRWLRWHRIARARKNRQ